jgi:high-affinity nickel-transport protein
VTTVFSILVLGFFLGMRHATDVDHVVAVTTIVSRERSVRGAALLGSLWGVGHTLTIVLVGGAIILFSIVIPPRVGLSMEMAVAVMLVVLGALNATGAMERIDEAAHAARHGVAPGEAHAAAHEGRPSGLAAAARSLVVGVVHGLAGSAAVALLVLTTLRDTRWAVLYLVVFGVGTIAGMMLLTIAMVTPLALAARRMTNLPRTMARVTGLVSVALGIFLAYRIGIVDGLFTGNPQWTPQ